MSEIQGKPVFGVCACKEKVQVLSVDQVVDLIQQMAENNWQVPEDYIPKTSVNGIIEQNTKAELKLWIGTQAEYNAYAEDKSNLFAIITDDPSLKEIENILNQYGKDISNINGNINKIISGDIPAGMEVIYDTAVNIDAGNSTEIYFKDGSNVNSGDVIEVELQVKAHSPIFVKFRFDGNFVQPNLHQYQQYYVQDGWIINELANLSVNIYSDVANQKLTISYPKTARIIYDSKTGWSVSENSSTANETPLTVLKVYKLKQY